MILGYTHKKIKFHFIKNVKKMHVGKVLGESAFFLYSEKSNFIL